MRLYYPVFVLFFLLSTAFTVYCKYAGFLTSRVDEVKVCTSLTIKPSSR